MKGANEVVSEKRNSLYHHIINSKFNIIKKDILSLDKNYIMTQKDKN